MHSDNKIMKNQNQNFDVLEAILQSRTLQEKHSTPLATAVSAIVSKNILSFNQVSREFTGWLTQHQHIYLHPSYISETIQQIKFMVCKNNKLYSFKGDYRAYCLVGRVVSVYKRKKSNNAEELEHRDQFMTLIQQGIIRLFEDGNLPLQKHQKNYSLTDVLLNHDMPDGLIDEVFIGTEAYSPFVPLQQSVLMLVPSKILKPDCLAFLRSSLLHVYLDEASLVSKIITKEVFYKNSHLRGIYFVDEGEVETKSGRILARGWTTYGKAKASGFGWKFKPIPFIRFLVKSPAIWKQFINDLKLNDEYPFNIIHILDLNEDDDFTGRVQWKGLGRKKLGNRSNKLPKINRSLDETKYLQIQKLRHYDNRINDIFLYKQDLLTRKMKGYVHNQHEPLYRDEKTEMTVEKKKKQILRMNSKRSELSKRQNDSKGENVLILSVLKRLESITDINTPEKHKLSIEYGPPYQRPLFKSNSKRQANKITPMQIHSQLRHLKKNKRYG